MAIVIIYYLVSILLFHFTVNGLENNLGRTPIMGWMAWTRFMCEVDCINHPRDCIRYPVWLYLLLLKYLYFFLHSFK